MTTIWESKEVRVFGMDENGTIYFTQTLTTNAEFENKQIKVVPDGRLGIIRGTGTLTSFLVDEHQQVELADSWIAGVETGGRLWGIPGCDYVDDYQMILAALSYPITMTTLRVDDDAEITATGHEMASAYDRFLAYVPRTGAFFQLKWSPVELAQLELFPDGSMHDHGTFIDINGAPLVMEATRNTRTFVGLGGGTYDIGVLQGDEQSNFVVAQELELPDSWNYADLYLSFDDRYALTTFANGPKNVVLLEFQPDLTLEEVDALDSLGNDACAITPDSRFAVITEGATLAGQELRVYRITTNRKLQYLPEK